MFTGYPKPRRAAAIAAVGLAALVAAAPLGASGSAGAAGELPPLIAADTGADVDPLPFWGAIDCESRDRHRVVETGGDTHPTITGEPQGDSAFRRLTVIDGDEFWGERCELGFNNRGGPTAFYREGKRRITAISVRLTPTFPIAARRFQVVTQMKQTQPAASGGGTPALELQVWRGRWRLIRARHRGLSSMSSQLWWAPAREGVWTRFVFDVRYSKRPNKGIIQLSADLNGDGDFDDGKERSPRMRTFTLKTEVRGGFPDGLRPGRPVPSHLRAGVYHDPEIACPGPVGCSVDIDNVQVLGY
jgi:hypothetical protein